MRVLITGATNGMGRGVAEALAAQDGGRHEVIFMGRSPERGAAMVDEITQRTVNPNLSYVNCDLTRLDDVRSAVAVLAERFESLDAVFVNAGVGYASSRVPTPDGLDPHFQVNYLSHFALVLHLLPFLERSERGGRVVFNVFAGGEIHWDDLQMERTWDYERGIRQAMVAKRLFLARLDRMYREPGRVPLSFFGFQTPKVVWTHQVDIIPGWMRFMAGLSRMLGQFVSIERCGEMMAPLFTDDAKTTVARSGKLLTWRKGRFVEVPEDALVRDEVNQERLWRVSLQLCHDESTSRCSAARSPRVPAA